MRRATLNGMRLGLLWAGLSAFLGLAGAASAQVPAVITPPTMGPAPDYRQDSAWLCRPGETRICVIGLDAVKVDATGGRTPEPFTPATDPKVDCFYIYPTVSKDPTPFADLTPGPEEVSVVKSQIARFTAKCRVYAPLYRQVTLAGLNAPSAKGGAAIDWSPPYVDVLAAWRDYLARDNKGRGVILIGHSQGSIMLARLIAEEIEGKPVAKRLIAAYLAGHPQVTVPAGADVGGTFKSTPLCRAATQTGCIVVWSSYDASAMPPFRIFERAPAAGMTAACVNPAALAGGKAPLDSYLARPKAASETDPPYVHDAGGYQGECVTDALGSVLKVSVDPSRPFADLRQALLTSVASRSPTWGLHGLDVTLTEGSLLSLADQQIAAYLAKR